MAITFNTFGVYDQTWTSMQNDHTTKKCSEITEQIPTKEEVTNESPPEGNVGTTGNGKIRIANEELFWAEVHALNKLKI